MNHIRDKLPDMKARLNTLMGQTQQELNSFGDATFLGEQHRVSIAPLRTSARTQRSTLASAGLSRAQAHDGIRKRLCRFHRWNLHGTLH